MGIKHQIGLSIIHQFANYLFLLGVMIVIQLDYASGCNKSSKISLLGLFIFIRRITCFGRICFVIKWFKNRYDKQQQ